MIYTDSQLKEKIVRMIESFENEVVEFKEARTNYSFNDIGKYFSALSNEANLRGLQEAWLIFGISDDKRYVGTEFRKQGSLQSLKKEIVNGTNERLTFLEIYELTMEKCRVIAFQIPPAIRGIPTTWQGAAYAREHESISPLPMNKVDLLRSQIGMDWSKEIVEDATIEDLDEEAIKRARELFSKRQSDRKKAQEVLKKLSDIEVLNKAGITIKGKITRTALLLLGKSEAKYFFDGFIPRITWTLYNADNSVKAYEHFDIPMLMAVDKVVQKSIVHQADRNKYHPVRNYLNSLQWDGQERIRYVLHHFLGAPVDELTYESMKMFLLGAIARAFRPGIKFEYMLCLVGGQGVGKSTFFRFMAVKDDWFTDDIGKLDSEKVYCQLRGHWMIEMSEMVATARSKSIEETKSFLSRQKETYRDSYAVYALDRPRQCVFGGTSNIKRFLPFDRTGNRRFVPVQTNRAEMEVHILENEKESRQYIDQVWAEAMMLYRNGNFKLAFSKETEAQLDKLRQEFMADDTEAGMIQAWLDEHEDRKVCSLMLFKEALDNPYIKPKKAETDRICEIMNTSIVGWKQGTMTRFKDYGTQRSWVCVNENCKRDAKDLKNENDWYPVTEEKARQMELPFR